MRSSRHKPNKQQRAEIANAAARLVAEGEAEDFAEAKLKAAQNLGLADSRNMPDNSEVQTALIKYLHLFEGKTLVERLEKMRRAALSAMQFLQDFEPRLVGPVLYGSAVRHSPVTLHLYTDELESVTRFLFEGKIEYQLIDTRLKVNSRESFDFPTFIVLNEGLEFELVVFPWSFNSHPPLSGLNGRPYRRADTNAVRELLDQSLLLDENNFVTNPVRDST